MTRYKCFLTPGAKSDVGDAITWSRAINKTLAILFRQELRRVLELLATNPLTHAARYGEIRIAVLHRFPYTVHYSINSAAEQVLIIGVYHEARDPKVWQDRLDPSL